MNRFDSITTTLRWFLALLLVAFVAGCGGGNGSPASSAKAITAYSLAGVTGTINETAKTVAVTMPSGTNVKALIAAFTTTGASVQVGTPAVTQVSGTTPNDFTTSKAYIVNAADGTTATYTVTVTVAANTAKAITAYSIAGATGTINKTQKTIAVTLPNGTSLTSQIATFTSTGASVKVGTTPQVSGTTMNNFTGPVAYIVTAADGSIATYTVTVTVALITDNAITAYSLAGVAGVITEPAHTIAVTVPHLTDVTALVATFTTTGASVKVGATTQVSGTTMNNFTGPMAYIVTAADTTTMATYTVTVSVATALGPAPVDLGTAGNGTAGNGTAGNFVILAKTAVSTTGATAVVGDIGVSPAATSYLTGFSLTKVGTTSATSPLVTGTLYGADMTTPTNSMLTTAVSDMETAFTDAAGRTNPTATELYAGDISGQILPPGLYKWSTGVLITNVGVTLSGGANDVWIFQIAQDLTVNNGAIITLGGNAQAKNIFWQVSGQATLGTTADFKGIILSQTLISLNTGAVLHGRALAQTAVTLNASKVGP